MKFLAGAWKATVGVGFAGWADQAVARGISTWNVFAGENLARWQIGLPPTQVYPAAAATGGCVITTATKTGGVKLCTLVIKPATNANIWGVAIFRDAAEITAAGWANCIAIVPRDDVDEFTYIDSPLDAGTYHYRVAQINTDGVMGTVLADSTATVT